MLRHFLAGAAGKTVSSSGNAVAWFNLLENSSLSSSEADSIALRVSSFVSSSPVVVSSAGSKLLHNHLI